MSLLLDQYTPDRSETTTGSVEAAAKVYESHVLADEIPEDIPDDPAEAFEQYQIAAGIDPIDDTGPTDDTDASTPPTAIDDETSAIPDGPITNAEAGPADYEGTDVWLIELPQFGDERRDLDDYLQNRWLGLIPPAVMVEALLPDASTDSYTGDVIPVGPSAGDGHATDAGWLAAIDMPENLIGTYPTGLNPLASIAETTPDPQAMDGISLSMFGLLPRIHPSEHPAVEPTTPGGTHSDTPSVDPQEYADRAEGGDWPVQSDLQFHRSRPRLQARLPSEESVWTLRRQRELLRDIISHSRHRLRRPSGV